MTCVERLVCVAFRLHVRGRCSSVSRSLRRHGAPEAVATLLAASLRSATTRSRYPASLFRDIEQSIISESNLKCYKWQCRRVDSPAHTYTFSPVLELDSASPEIKQDVGIQSTQIVGERVVPSAIQSADVVKVVITCERGRGRDTENVLSSTSFIRRV